MPVNTETQEADAGALFDPHTTHDMLRRCNNYFGTFPFVAVTVGFLGIDVRGRKIDAGISFEQIGEGG